MRLASITVLFLTPPEVNPMDPDNGSGPFTGVVYILNYNGDTIPVRIQDTPL